MTFSNKMIFQNEDTGKASPHEEYITRHFSGVKQDGDLIHIDAKVIIFNAKIQPFHTIN